MTAWTRTEHLDHDTAIDTTVVVPDLPRIAIPRDVLERFLLEAGYTPRPDA